MFSIATKRADALRAWIGVGAPILGLVAITIMLALTMLASFARETDDTFAANSTTLVANGLAGKSSALGDLALDYANWDEALDNISVRWNRRWIEGNIYSSVAEGMILFRADGSVRYSWFEEELAPQAAAATSAAVQAAARIPELRRLARAPTPAETVAHTFARMGDRLVVVAVAPITAEDDAARIARRAPDGHDYLAVIEAFTPQELADAGASMALEGFRFAAAAPARRDTIALPVVAADGTRVGELRWRHVRPGAAAFGANAWPVVVGLILIGALTILIARRLVARQVEIVARGEAALETSRLKAEFLARVGHELRTPLDGIIGYAEIIHEETESASTRADAERIVAAARHLNHLLNDILDQSRLDAGRIRFHKEALPVQGLLAEVQGLVRPAAAAAGVNLTVRPCASADFVVGDHVRLRQCLLHLIGNAIKFAPCGNVAIETRVDRRADGDFVVFDIVDDGIGIAKSELANLFKPFSQANARVGETYGGAGLGLSISRDLARAMGGDIAVASEPNKGSTFSLSMPMAPASEMRAA